MSDRFIEGLSRLGLQLSEQTIKKEIYFLDELLRWNQRINLTSIRNRDEAIEKHLLDSLLLLPHLHAAQNIIDMGSGGGLPGIPLAIALSALQVVSVDSVGKKINFQKHIKRLLQLDNLTVVQSRIEDLEPVALDQEKYDLIVSRAFSSLETSLCCADPWLKSGGRLLVMKGPEGRNELKAARATIESLGFTDPTVLTYSLPFSRAERQLVVLKKY
ncbi:MAG: 16S rRNA (guanine(527)-N(7))-methyltransferase RsmG [Desulfuromusa sp.]|nr:16S rRNA (guanine(527)-N(7))-methyltransferase RsmG [Desulfuromusa sp.]